MAPTQAKAQRAENGKGYQLIPVVGPSEGVDLRLSQTLLPAGRAHTLINFSLEEPGALVTRAGYQKFSTSSLGVGRIQGAARIYLNTAIPSAASTIFTIAAFNGGLFTQTDAGVWSAQLLSGLSATNDIHFPQDRDLVAVFDGSTRAWKSTNGSSWTKFGMDAPTKSSTLSSKAGGSLSASEFEINFTYKDRDLAVESNGSSAASTITLGATGAIEVQCANSTNPAVDAIVVYARNKTAGETLRRKVSSFAMQSTAALSHSTFTITSSAWTSNDQEPDDHDVPGVYDFGTIWKNRWWARDATRTNRLHFTQLFQAQSWPGLFYIDIPFNRGDEIMALVPLGDSLLIFGATTIFLVIGQTSLDFEVRPTLASQDGALGPRAVCVIENGVVHAGAAGVWIFDGVSDKLLSYDLLPAWQDLVQNAANADLERVACTYHQALKELRIAVPRRYPSAAQGEWIMDLSRSSGDKTAWTSTDRDIVGYVPFDGPEVSAGNRNRLLSWGSTNGVLFEEAVGTSANSSNLVAEYEGPGLTLGSVRGRFVDVRGEYEPHGGTLTEQGVVDGVALPAQTITIGSGLSQFDTSTFDVSVFGGSGRRMFHKMRPLNSDGRTYVQRFIYSGTEKFRLYGYHVGLVNETRPRAFSE
jgi:hypothetical protein